MTRMRMAAASMILVLVGLVGLHTALLQNSNPFSLQDGQVCVQTTCASKDLRVTTYQMQPALQSAPPSAWVANGQTARSGKPANSK